MIWLLEALLFFGPMIVEARRAARNERIQRARGGIEPGGDVYAAMRVIYPAAFAAMILEGAVRGQPARISFDAGLAVFAAAKALKWWAILTLGACWTFRVIVVPGEPLVVRGPYRVLRHPNYVGVLLELAGAAVMTAAAVSGPAAIVLFGMLIKRRVLVEERALHSAARHPPCGL